MEDRSLSFLNFCISAIVGALLGWFVLGPLLGKLAKLVG